MKAINVNIPDELDQRIREKYVRGKGDIQKAVIRALESMLAADGCPKQTPADALKELMKATTSDEIIVTTVSSPSEKPVELVQPTTAVTFSP